MLHLNEFIVSNRALLMSLCAKRLTVLLPDLPQNVTPMDHKKGMAEHVKAAETISSNDPVDPSEVGLAEWRPQPYRSTLPVKLKPKPKTCSWLLDISSPSLHLNTNFLDFTRALSSASKWIQRNDWVNPTANKVSKWFKMKVWNFLCFTFD